MKHIANLKCWEITQCRKMDCQARMEPETPCWELAMQITEGFYNPFRVCRECIVYLINHETGVLSSREIEEILKVRKLI